MKFNQNTTEIYIPDDAPLKNALARTTHLCIAAHQDDIEIMAASSILECFQREDKWFTGVVVTDGRGSARAGIYEKYSDEEMRLVRFKEQRKAALIGEYSAQIMLDYPSKIIKDGKSTSPINDILAILQATNPSVVYTHNLADKHATHVGVAIKIIKAMRSLEENERPKNLYGCEVWRDLDWMRDSEKVILDTSKQSNLQAALLGIFDSQISGGKRYDLASMGRRLANATYFSSHDVDDASGLSYAMDLTPLAENPDLDIQNYVQGFIDRFSQDVDNLIRSVM
ncbi:MAG: PIG-L family deacetylase [Anaerolineae bacterium]|jgi:LmbE family N-acetylglucosaminyl deacetylase|nr:PIG-L family deacetylase [Anaerolineae bacterium]MBT4311278.1 PIG-L family deacetylase [Anaerolineae bacterium]MBT4457107.1 PIG-L family deacetylase [Anaerolineae bacterium]MBT4841808.1 PIG-L family deacetylase [Anaerolineae bacterium]MBT6061702.1 PIG-L family deacetylase [Anaerolineae bacterium]